MLVVPASALVAASKQAADRIRAQLDVLAVELGRRDGLAGVNPMFGRPMVGQVELQAATALGRREVLVAHVPELSAAERQEQAVRARGAWLDAINPEELPPQLIPGWGERAAGIGMTGRQYHARTKGPIIVAFGFLVAEFVVLVEPVNALLGSGTGFTRPAVALAGAATGIVGGTAHARDHFGRRADASQVTADRPREARAVGLHNTATIALLVAVALAVAARAMQAYFGDGVSLMNLAGFVTLQLLFLLGALVFPALHRDLRTSAGAQVLDAHRQRNKADLANAEATTSEARGHHDATLAEFDADTTERNLRYLGTLAGALRVPFLADMVRLEMTGNLPPSTSPGGPPPPPAPHRGAEQPPPGPAGADEPSDSSRGESPPADDLDPEPSSVAGEGQVSGDEFFAAYNTHTAR